MTTERWTDEMLDKLVESAEATRRSAEANTTAISELKAELREEVKRWDERFFQLTRDNLSTAKTIIVTAGTVVILSPVLQAFAPAIQAVVTRLINGQTP